MCSFLNKSFIKKKQKTSGLEILEDPYILGSLTHCMTGIQYCINDRSCHQSLGTLMLLPPMHDVDPDFKPLLYSHEHIFNWLSETGL